MIYLKLILLPLVENMIDQKTCNNKYTFMLFVVGGFEIIFVKLIEVIIFYI